MMFPRFWACLNFSSPEPNTIVILLSDSYWIKELILKDVSATTLNLFTGNNGIHVTPMLIARTFLRLRFIDCLKIEKDYFFRNLFRQIFAQYVLACLDQVNAKVVMTFIDNSRFFHYLSRIDKQRTYFAIQNGTRTLACVRDSLPPAPHLYSVISMTNFFCFGQRDVDLFNRHGHKVDSYLTVGSLVGGYYKSVVSVPLAKPQFDLCLISQWAADFFGDNAGDDRDAVVPGRYRPAIEGLNLFLLRLLSETGLSLVICPREDSDAAEVSFFTGIFGEKARIAESDRKNFSTYRVMEQSRLVVALNSTTLLEAMAWGHKVLWCNVPSDEHYEMPEAGISYFCGNDYGAFKERVLLLLSMPQKDYETLTREGARYINNFDLANPPHKVIRAAVLEALAGKTATSDIPGNYVQR